MKFNSLVFIWVLAVLTVIAPNAPKGWRGIVPLHSTRTDVEKSLGPADKPGPISIYKTPNESLYVEYATEPCKGSLPGWNVRAGTVLQFTVRSKSEQSLSDIRLDIAQYTKSYDDAMGTYYTSVREGIRYAVSADGTVESVSYIPSVRDSNLRCRGFPPYNGEVTSNQRMFDSYGDLSWEDEMAHLDNFAVALQHDPDSIGYIIAYAGRRACVDEAKDRALRAKKYVVEIRGIQASRIKWIDGGYREEPTVVLQPAPRGAPELTASPTLKPSEMRIRKDCKAKTRKRSRRAS